MKKIHKNIQRFDLEILAIVAVVLLILAYITDNPIVLFITIICCFLGIIQCFFEVKRIFSKR